MDNENKSDSKVNSKKPVKPKPINLDRYQDLEGVSIKKLETGLWYIEHRDLLRKILIVLLVIVGGTSWLYTLSKYGFYVFKGMNDDNAMLRELVRTQGFSHDYVREISGQQLEFSPVQVFEYSNQKSAPRYDLIVEVKNPNLRHAGTLSYSFVSSAGIIVSGETNILPGDDKFITALGLELAERPQNVKFVSNQLNLSRLDARSFPDWDKFKKEHFDITVADIKFTPPRLSGLSEKLNVSKLEFTVTNNSAYNIWRSDLIIILSNRGQRVAVNQYLLNRFKSGERRAIAISLPGVIKAEQIEVIPQVDILDQNNYFDFDTVEANPEIP